MAQIDSHIDDTKENQIPFELSAAPFYSASNIRHLEKIMQDVKNGTARFSEHDLTETDE